MTARITRLTTAARLRLSRASASCQSERPAISSATAAGRGATTLVMSANRGLSVIADLRIKQAIGEIDQEVEQNDERPVEDDHAHDERVIAVERALHEIAADAGNPEDGLDHHRSGDDAGHGRAE